MIKIGTRYKIQDLRIIEVERRDIGMDTELNIKDDERVISSFEPLNTFSTILIVAKLTDE